MIKEAINFLAAPVYSFSIFIGLFFLAMKRMDIVGTKKFGIGLLVFTLVTFAWMVADPIFFSIISLPDNIPIIILNALVIWSTWFALYKGHQNDLRIEAGESPLEGSPENREKVWAWPNLVYTELFAGIVCTVFLVVWAIFFKAGITSLAGAGLKANTASKECSPKIV